MELGLPSKRILFSVPFFILGPGGCFGVTGDPTGSGGTSSSIVVSTSLATSAGDGSVSTGAGGSDNHCTKNELSLIAVNYGDTDRYFVAVALEGKEIALLLDTGSGRTFLFQGDDAPPFAPNIGTISIGCEDLPVAGRRISWPQQTVGNGLEVKGLLGMDFLLGKPSLLDVARGTLTRFAVEQDDLLETEAHVWIPFDNVQSHALVSCVLDGIPIRLMFDTAAGHTMHVGVAGRPGDVETWVQDAEGTNFPVYQGWGGLVFPTFEERTVPLYRAPHFPYFEQTIAELGGNLHGLLGLTSFPHERLYFSGEKERIYMLGE